MQFSNIKGGAKVHFSCRYALKDRLKMVYFVKSLFVHVTSSQERKIRLTREYVRRWWVRKALEEMAVT